jgi:DNA-binding CsgD family transcriptional regulator
MAQSLSHILDATLHPSKDIALATRQSDTFMAFSSGLNRLGFIGFSYWSSIPDETCRAEFEYTTFWNEESRGEWIEEGFHVTNPVKKAMQSNAMSYRWNGRSLTDFDRDFQPSVSCASGLGARAGAMIKIQTDLTGLGVIVAYKDEYDDVDNCVMDALFILGNALCLKLKQLQVQSAAPPVAEPSAARRLSDRQMDVLRWIVAGKTNYEISQILAPSERNIVDHVSEILRKLDLTSRTQAAAWYVSVAEAVAC